MSFELITKLRRAEGLVYLASEETVAKDLSKLFKSAADRIEELQDHCNTFCKCPSHGPSLIQIPEGEFDD